MNFYKKKALRKLIFSCFILLIYIFGMSLPLPGIDTKILSNITPSTSFVLSMTGINLDAVGLFSLGLGPWMSSLILWQILIVTKLFHVESLTKKQSYRYKYIFSLVLGIVQSFTIISAFSLFRTGINQPPIWALILILVSGLSILIWLGNLNAVYGLGGGTLLIIASMLRTWVYKISIMLKHQELTEVFFLKVILVMLFILILSYFIFRFFQGERRIPIAHAMLDNRLYQDSYLPLSVKPAGGTPFMFAFSIFLIPQYLLLGLKFLFPHNKIFSVLYLQMQINQILGIIFLLLGVIILTYGYSYVNIDYKELAKNFQKSGDYIYGVYPGKNTERYLFHKVTIMATASAVVNILIVGIPTVFGAIYPEMSYWIYLIPTWIVLIILMQDLQKEFVTIYSRGSYKPFLE